MVVVSDELVFREISIGVKIVEGISPVDFEGVVVPRVLIAGLREGVEVGLPAYVPEFVGQSLDNAARQASFRGEGVEMCCEMVRKITAFSSEKGYVRIFPYPDSIFILRMIGERIVAVRVVGLHVCKPLVPV